MFKIENTEVFGWEAAIRGMRNPMNSWDKSDSHWCEEDCPHVVNGTEPAVDCVNGKWGYCIGENDLKLMKKLSKAGNDHAKFLRMITVTCDITAMQTWWAEFDTYKVGTVRNSCSKMHKIHVKPFNYDDFTHIGIDEVAEEYPIIKCYFQQSIDTIEWLRVLFNDTQDRKYWRALIEMLPSSYELKATVQINYQVGKVQHAGRHNHKLVEWHQYCEWLESLPYFKEVCLND